MISPRVFQCLKVFVQTCCQCFHPHILYLSPLKSLVRLPWLMGDLRSSSFIWSKLAPMRKFHPDKCPVNPRMTIKVELA